jgi:hypothetical protein
MHEGLLFVILLMLGFGAFLFSIVYVAVAILGGLFRGLRRLFTGQPVKKRVLAVPPKRRERTCPRPNCRRVESRDARFCSQCGARLGDQEGR